MIGWRSYPMPMPRPMRAMFHLRRARDNGSTSEEEPVSLGVMHDSGGQPPNGFVCSQFVHASIEGRQFSSLFKRTRRRV